MSARVTEAMVEAAAKVISPQAWKERLRHLERAEHWERIAINDTQRSLVASHRENAMAVIQHSLQTARTALAAALSIEPGEAEGWRDISTAPRDGTWLFLYVPGHGPASARWRARMGWESHNSGREITRATHWRPMFESPVQP